jgi:hypothetical protein
VCLLTSSCLGQSSAVRLRQNWRSALEFVPGYPRARGSDSDKQPFSQFPAIGTRDTDARTSCSCCCHSPPVLSHHPHPHIFLKAKGSLCGDACYRSCRWFLCGRGGDVIATVHPGCARRDASMASTAPTRASRIAASKRGQAKCGSAHPHGDNGRHSLTRASRQVRGHHEPATPGAVQRRASPAAR